MAFVNELISPEDRARYKLEEFERSLPFSNPEPDWAIDRDQDIFLRVVRPSARGNEPGDADAIFEKDFQFHWKGFDYLVSTRSGLDTKDLEALPGKMFHAKTPIDPNAKILGFYVRHIGEKSKPSSSTPSALLNHQDQLYTDLIEVLGVSWGGICTFISPEGAKQARRAVIKIAPRAEVTS